MLLVNCTVIEQGCLGIGVLASFSYDAAGRRTRLTYRDGFFVT